jgi:hypothetical protein
MSEPVIPERCDHGIFSPHECSDCFDRLQRAIATVADAFGDNESHIIEAISERPFGDASQYMLHAQFAVKAQESLMLAKDKIAELERDCEMARVFREQLRAENIAAEAKVAELERINAEICKTTNFYIQENAKQEAELKAALEHELAVALRPYTSESMVQPKVKP